ncbi:family 16 glycoside hydrolase [Planctomycetota bacterium]
MNRYTVSYIFAVLLTASGLVSGSTEAGWIPLFNGKNMDGWRASEHPDSFSVKDGVIVAEGPRSHLFYVGSVQSGQFKNFELKVEVKTFPGSNGGIYFHTAYQETGWPGKGYEVQVNNSFIRDPRKTGSLYAIQDVPVAVAQDEEWFTEHIIVQGQRVVIKVDGRTTVDWTEAADFTPPASMAGRILGRGTFALQGHDPKSKVCYRNIRVRPLPDSVASVTAPQEWVSLFDGKTLNGWQQINGTATYEVAEGVIKGTTVAGSPNSFLCSQLYGDFELEFEVQLDSRLNSGVQIRSNSLPEYRAGRVHGYQVEIATNGTAGYIYDEARRGWLSLDRSDPWAQAAFQKEKWNHYRVVCVGDSLCTWVNGVPVADVVDDMTATGFLGLQVHSFAGDPPAWVKWRNIRLKELLPTEPRKIQTVVVTGGHSFDHDPFIKVFQDMALIDFVEAEQKDHSELFEDITNWDYDVIVLYNMTQDISEKRQANLVQLLERGVGLVALHHTLAAYNTWPEFQSLIGGRFHSGNSEPNNKSGYQHDVDMAITVQDAKHPVTQGVSNFHIHDETYKGVWHAQDNHVLLTCDHPTSDKPIAWTRTHEGRARICTIQLGHDAQAYTNEAFRRLVANAIQWVSQQ